MKFKKLGAVAAVCAAMAFPAAQAASSSAWASIYDITFEVVSLVNGGDAWFTMGNESDAFDTIVQAGALGDFTSDLQAAYGPGVYSNQSTSAYIAESGGYASAAASAGTSNTGKSFVQVSGSTDLSTSGSGDAPVRFYGNADLNQPFDGVPTLGYAWLTLSARTTLTMHGIYDLWTSLTAPTAGEPGSYSRAYAEVYGGLFEVDGFNYESNQFEYGDTASFYQNISVSGQYGDLYDSAFGQLTDISISNDSDAPVRVLFQTSAYVQGFMAYGIPAAVPEPDTYGLMALGLGLAGWLARRRSRSTASNALLQPAAA